jgi:ribosomal protein L5
MPAAGTEDVVISSMVRAILEDRWTTRLAADNLRPLTGGQSMATKDKNTKKSMEKKPAQMTLKEKRLAKKAKK